MSGSSVTLRNLYIGNVAYRLPYDTRKTRGSFGVSGLLILQVAPQTADFPDHALRKQGYYDPSNGRNQRLNDSVTRALMNRQVERVLGASPRPSAWRADMQRCYTTLAIY